MFYELRYLKFVFIAIVRYYDYNVILYVLLVLFKKIIMDYITAKEAASKWGITERRVQVLCSQKMIEGVVRLGWAWAIPKNASKPYDKRKRRIK